MINPNSLKKVLDTRILSYQQSHLKNAKFDRYYDLKISQVSIILQSILHE